MLEKKDLEMIAEIVAKTVEPIRKDVKELRDTTKDLQKTTKDLQNTTTDLQNTIKDLQNTTTDLQDTTKVLQDDVKEIRLTLENETNKKINIIAEGHLDLSRKLDEALKVENEKEMLLLRVTSLENEVRRLKARIEQIA